jgi:hypothetical protein
MRYIIPEKRIKEIVEKYLDNIDWNILETGDRDFPLEVFGFKGDKDATFIVQRIVHRYGESSNLMIRSSFQEKLESLFGKEIVSGGEYDEPNLLVMNWFNKRFKNFPVEDYLYMDNHFTPDYVRRVSLYGS